MQRREAASIVQGLRGGQGQILLLFLLTGGAAMTIADMEADAGLSNDSVSAAVKGLVAKGYLCKQVGERGKASYLPASDSFFGLLGSLFLPAQNPVFPDSGVLSSVVDVVAIGSNFPLLLQQQQQQQTPQNPVFPDSGKQLKKDQGEIVWQVETGEKTEEEISACYLALRQVGIIGSKAQKLAHAYWTTPEYIQAVVDYTVGENTFDNPVGMAIRRMEDNFLVDLDVDTEKKPGHPVGCQCGCRKLVKQVASGLNRYTNNSFSRSINTDLDDGELE